MKLPAVLLLGAAALAHTADAAVKFENEFVRASLETYAPRSRTAAHKHEFNRVVVFLDAGEIQTRQQNGRIDKNIRRAGEVVWIPAGGMHTTENLLATPLQTLEVALKKPPSGKPFRISPRDPLKLDPEHYSIELDNSQVRVMRIKYPANYKEPLHQHFSQGRLTIPVTGFDITVSTEGQPDRAAKAKPGDATWSAGPIVHGVRTGASPVELIVVELK